MKKVLIGAAILILMPGCSGANEEVEFETPHTAFDRTINELTLDNLDILPDIEEIDDVTYVDGVLMVNENYSLPPDFNPGLEEEVIDAYEEMFEDGAEEDLDFVVVSDFRTYQEQEQVYEDYVENNGEEDAEQYSALPGHSEHQTGLAIDVGSTESASSAEVSFEETPEFDWMKDVAHEYGFIIRYPEGEEDITGFMYEPWHLRYVGVELATEVYEEDVVLEEYLNLN